MPGMQLLPETITNLTNFLNAHLNKPGGITITQKEVSSFAADTVSLQQVADYEMKNRTSYTSGNTVAAYILLSDANYSTQSVLGIAYLNTSIVLFERNILAHSGGFGEASREKVESGVTEHEFGHLLGLVNLGTPMTVPHEDNAHVHHCTNTDCLMYYETEIYGLPNRLNDVVPSLDENCVNDLIANGGK
jgi:predicted Zn-dependent protease